MSTSSDPFIRDCAAVREKSPLVHCITNYVAMGINANALLAVGASPLMSFCPEEMEEIVGIASALVVNIGCLDRHEIEGMKIAAATAHRLGKPWVLDPVGAGASRIRTQTSLDLIRDSHPTVIRGNASEILALAGSGTGGRGVESTQGVDDAEDAARALADRTGAAVLVTGPVDFAVAPGGAAPVRIANGVPLLTRVTGVGCAQGALCAALCAAAEDDALLAAVTGALLVGIAGERAARTAQRPGSFQIAFLDALDAVDAAAIEAEGRVTA